MWFTVSSWAAEADIAKEAHSRRGKAFQHGLRRDVQPKKHNFTSRNVTDELEQKTTLGV